LIHCEKKFSQIDLGTRLNEEPGGMKEGEGGLTSHKSTPARDKYNEKGLI